MIIHENFKGPWPAIEAEVSRKVWTFCMASAAGGLAVAAEGSSMRVNHKSQRKFHGKFQNILFRNDF